MSRDAAETPWWALRYEAMAAASPALLGAPDADAEAQIAFALSLAGVRPGDKVVDVGCGVGRHAILLQEQGYEVTGLDLSPRLLRLAREAWSERNPGQRGPTWTPGDMRWPPTVGPAKAALLLGQSFGVFEEEADHLRALSALAEQLASGGRVVCELLNPYFWAAHATTRHLGPPAYGEGVDVVRATRFDAQRGRVEERSVAFVRGQRHEFATQSLRCWTPVELVALFKAAGFGTVELYGSDGWDVPEEPLPVHPEASVYLWAVATV